MSVIEAHKESERLLISQVGEIEELYFLMTNKSNMRFTDNFRQNVRGMIRQYGIDTVLESIKDIVNKYGSEGLDKLITFVVCKSNPKIYKTNYICGILKNKDKRNYVHQDTKNDIYSFVSHVIDEYGVECLDYVIEQYKHDSSFTNESFWNHVHTWEERHAVANYPQQIQAAAGVGVPATVEAYQASIEDSDGSVPNVNVVDQLTKDDVREAQYEAGLLLKYANNVDEWHIISKTKYNWTGWSDIANNNEKERIKKGDKPRSKKAMNAFIETIRRSVEAHREKLGIKRPS